MKKETKDFDTFSEEGSEVSQYEPPKIKTYTSEEILEQIGPAMACTSPDCVGG